MSPKARSTVRPLTLRPDASSEEQAYTRGLNEGMLRKVNRIKQEVAAREALGHRYRVVCGQRDRLAHALEEALAEIAYWLPDYLEGGVSFEHPRGSGPDRVTKLGRAALETTHMRD